MENLIAIQEPQYLHCDNPDCNHDETFEGPFREELINMPCPKCGENLLTEEDFLDANKVMEEMSAIANIMNSLSPEEVEEMTKNIELPEGVNPEDVFSLGVHVHNKSINFNLEKGTEEDKAKLKKK